MCHCLASLSNSCPSINSFALGGALLVTWTMDISFLVFRKYTNIASLVMLASEPPLIKIRSIFLCISLCKARNILSPVGDAVGSDTYFVFRDSAATAAIAAAWSVFSGGDPTVTELIWVVSLSA